MDPAGTDTVTSLAGAESTVASRCRVTLTGVAPGFTSTRPGVAWLPMTDGDTTHVAAVDVAPDGSSHDVAVASPPVVGSMPSVEAPERLAAILDALVDDASGASGPRTRSTAAARAFRRTPLFESVRLNRLARRILAATAVVFAPEDNAGNVRVRIDASDGARQISIVTLEEAEALRRATGH